MKIIKLCQTNIDQGPKGECFKNAYNWAKNNNDDNTFIIHGKITNVENKTFDHAWVEKDISAMVIDPTQGITISKAKYYDLLNVKPEAKYTLEDVAINMVRTNNWGPWTLQEVEDRFVARVDS